MKFHIYAKILGPYLPATKLHVGDCIIERNRPYVLAPEDRPSIPVVEESMFAHNRQHGVNNFIQYPQKPISSRNFQSEYSIRTEVDSYSISRALESAIERFDYLIANLSLAVKTKVRVAGNRRLRRDDENYDYEIFAAYTKTKGRFVRVELPRPLINGHNYFPVPIPKGFIAKTKRFMGNRDQIFYKALMYLQEAIEMKDTGNYNEVLRILCYIKCIELISSSLGVPSKKWDAKKAKNVKITKKDLFALAGKKIRVTEKSIKFAQKAWEARNNSDVAHASDRIMHFPGINHSTLDGVANEYLLKYKKYKDANSPQIIAFGGKKG